RARTVARHAVFGWRGGVCGDRVGMPQSAELLCGQVGRIDLAVRQQDRALHDIARLADVAGPSVGQEQCHGLLIDPYHGFTLALRALLGEVRGENGYFTSALTQGRDPNADALEAVEQV